MSDGGWIKLHRKFLNWEWCDTPEMVSLFVHLLLEANHEDRKWHGQTICRGQIITSRDRLSELTGLTVQQVRTCLLRFEQTGEITRKSTNKYTLITISNYDRYQVREDDEQPANNQQITNNQPTNNQQITTNKNIKKERIYNTQPIRESWRFLSSVQKSVCGFDKDRMAEMKRDIFRKDAEEIASQIGMTEQQISAFVRYWTEHNPGDDRIRAENENPFDVRSRMETWMDRDKPRQVTRSPEPQRKDRIQNLIDERTKFQQALYGITDTISADGSPDYQGEQ